MYILFVKFHHYRYLRIIKSKAKIFKFDVNLLLIKRDDFFGANMNTFTFYTEHAGEA